MRMVQTEVCRKNSEGVGKGVLVPYSAILTPGAGLVCLWNDIVSRSASFKQ